MAVKAKSEGITKMRLQLPRKRNKGGALSWFLCCYSHSGFFLKLPDLFLKEIPISGACS